jgi:dTDP-4-dehydrorhamnose 3,5-epimerase
VSIDDWERPSREAKVYRFVLSAAKPEILHIPGGYANGSMALTPDARLMVFSTTTLEESLADDFHFDARYWNPWEIVER